MKKINWITKIGLGLFILLIAASCEKWIDPDINTDPDSPAEASMQSILPAAQMNMAFNTVGGNDVARVTSEWMQYYIGVERQANAESWYLFRNGDCNNHWNTNYTTSMKNLKILIEKARDVDAYHFLGVGEVMMANTLGLTTDLWGDMPYSEAFQGNDNLTPAFDNQQAIYQVILNLLDSAYVHLNMPDSDLYPLAGDMLYDGDGAAWAMAAKALKARYTLHLCKKDATSWAKALAIINEGTAFTSNDDDLQMGFAGTSGNPLFMYMFNRGDIVMHKYFTDMLKLRFDPRLAAYVYPYDTIYDGAGFDNPTYEAATPGPAVADAETPVYFITYAEQLFIQAECMFYTGAALPDIRTALIGGVSASFNKHDVYSQPYIDAYTAVVDTMTGPVLLHEIMTQKYIALYGQVESYCDFRRTDNIIGLVPNPYAVTPEIPRRYPYPTDELTYNPNTPVGVTIWNRVWWDAE